MRRRDSGGDLATIDRTDERQARPAEPGHPRRADIQGLRGIAVLAVVAFHAELPLPGGYVGVDAFFVISGFVITTMLWRELRSTGKLDFPNFYARRVRRLLPALAVMLVAVAAMSVLFQSPLGAQHDTAHATASAATFLANMHFAGVGTGYFDASLTTNPLLHTWSLAVEEQFYLVFPLFLLWALRGSRLVLPHSSPRAGAAMIVSAGLLVSFVLSLVLTNATYSIVHIHNPAQVAFFSAPTRAWEFAAGAVVALAGTLVKRMPQGLAVAAGIVGAVMLLVSMRIFTPTTPFPGTAALLPVLGTALMLFAGMHTMRGVTKALSLKWLVKTGDISYGWYLWHWPIIVFARLMISSNTAVLTLAAIASLVPTLLSYRYVERPIRFRPNPPRKRALVIGAVCIVVPLVAALGLSVTASAAAKTSTMKDLAHQSRFHADVVRHCDSTGLITKRPPKCTWHATDPHGSVILLGDSNAGQFVEPIAAASQQDGFDLTVATSSECPFVDLVLLRNNVPYTACHRFVTTTIASIAKMHPKLVILASWGSGYIENSRYSFRDSVTGKLSTTPAAKAVEWQTAYTSVLHQFAEAGVWATVVDTIPLFPTWQLNQCPAVTAFSHLPSCGVGSNAAAIARQQAASYRAETRAVAAVPGMTQISFDNYLCGPSFCQTNRGKFFVYRDGSHLSVNGSLAFTPQFATLINDRTKAE